MALVHQVMPVDAFFVVVPVVVIAVVSILDSNLSGASGALASGTVRGWFLWPIGLDQDCFTGDQRGRDCSALITQQLTPEFRVEAKQRFFGRGPGLVWHRADRRTTKPSVCWPQAKAQSTAARNRFHRSGEPIWASKREHETPDVPERIAHFHDFSPAA